MILRHIKSVGIHWCKFMQQVLLAELPPRSEALQELLQFIGMMSTFSYLWCVIMNVFFTSLMLKLTFPLIVTLPSK